MLWDAFVERSPPVLAIVRLHRMRRGQAAVLIAWRAMDPAAEAPQAVDDHALLAQLAALGEGIVFAPDTAASPFVAALHELAVRYASRRSSPGPRRSPATR